MIVIMRFQTDSEPVVPAEGNGDVEQKHAFAHSHILQYQSQRKLVNSIITITKTDVKNNLPLQFCRKVIIIYMGQKLGSPNFEGEKSDDTYYSLPLTILLFGIVDNATQDGLDRRNADV